MLNLNFKIQNTLTEIDHMEYIFHINKMKYIISCLIWLFLIKIIIYDKQKFIYFFDR